MKIKTKGVGFQSCGRYYEMDLKKCNYIEYLQNLLKDINQFKNQQ